MAKTPYDQFLANHQALYHSNAMKKLGVVGSTEFKKNFKDAYHYSFFHPVKYQEKAAKSSFKEWRNWKRSKRKGLGIRDDFQ